MRHCKLRIMKTNYNVRNKKNKYMSQKLWTSRTQCAIQIMKNKMQIDLSS